MEAAGMVRREDCESDAAGCTRAHRAGLATMRQVAPHHVASVRAHFIDLMPPAELAAYHRALRPVAEHLRAERGAEPPRNRRVGFGPCRKP